ncbi:PepSY domain-containing protein [uncultured Actinomyces sp.]|uniref:PepSY domain-containing protein n=1 Tax=uncultured Actinomyces sp. TaxID=249061 RepID=UPI0025F9812A|nr:PepSY domain-containing protein [uncultured Actinomyces sp.]
MNPTASPFPSHPSRVSRATALAHRWLSASAGLVLLVITLSGAILPHQSEIMRSLNPAAYARDAGPDQASLPQAVTTVESTRPDESVLSAIRVGDVIEVRTVQATYTVAPSNSSEIRQVSTTPSWVAALDNLHHCLLSCQGPGHVDWMSQEIPHTHWWGGHRGLTIGGLLVATSGIVLLVLTISGLRVWWPLQRYRRTALSARWRLKRPSRDTDLLKAAGLVLLPLLFLWGYYASAFSIHPTRPDSLASAARTENVAETGSAHDQDIGPRRAVAAAQEASGGWPVALLLPEPDDPSSTYTVWLSQGTQRPYGQARGDVAVHVDPSTGRTETAPAPSGSRAL